jgi:hypothetical protein
MTRTEMRAPVSVWVTNLLVRQGDYAATGQMALSIVDADSFWVDDIWERPPCRASTPAITRDDAAEASTDTTTKFATDAHGEQHADAHVDAPADEHVKAHEVTRARVHVPSAQLDDDGGAFFLGVRARPQVIPPKRPRFGP